MPSPIKLERHWLMDSFGRLIHYDANIQRMITQPFFPQEFPNLFTFLAMPEKFPSRGVLRMNNSIPSSIPPTNFITTDGPHQIAIQEMGREVLLCSHPENGDLTWGSKHAGVWEKFVLLNKKTLLGLSILCDPDMALIERNGETVSHLTLGPYDRRGNFAIFAHSEICIAHNLKEFSKLAEATVHEPISLSLREYYEDKYFTIVVTPKKALHHFDDLLNPAP